MNRLRQLTELSPVARWILARAYLLAGQGEAAQELAAQAPISVEVSDEGRELMRSFRSPMRDLGIILVSLVQLGDLERARVVSEGLISELNDARPDNTHSLATALIGLGAWLTQGVSADEAAPGSKGFSFALREGEGDELQHQSSGLLWGRALTSGELAAGSLTLRNTSAVTLYASVHRRGVARVGEERAVESGLSLSVQYVNSEGEVVTPASTLQGAHLTAVLRVKNTSTRPLGQLALTYGAPSGWEIENERLATSSEPGAAPAKGLYQDFRDDRVLSYFELSPQEEREFRVRVIAAYAGRFYHPATSVEAMYEPGARALVPGFWAEVVR